MDAIWMAIAAWWWLILLGIFGGIGAFGSFVSTRLKAKDKLKLEGIKNDTKQANINLQVAKSQEMQEAMRLRALQIEHNLPTHYIPILDDPTKE